MASTLLDRSGDLSMHSRRVPPLISTPPPMERERGSEFHTEMGGERRAALPRRSPAVRKAVVAEWRDPNDWVPLVAQPQASTGSGEVGSRSTSRLAARPWPRHLVTSFKAKMS